MAEGSDARSERDAVQDEADALVAVRGDFVELVALEDQIDRAQAIESAAMARDVVWSDLVAQAFDALIHVAAISGFEVQPKAGVAVQAVLPGGELTTGADVLGVPGIATMQIEVQTSTLPDAGLWTSALLAIEGFQDVRITSASLAEDGDEPAHYASSVVVTVTPAAQACRWGTESEEAIADEPADGGEPDLEADESGACGA
ncbi:hypothetical protein [Cellulomonas triticagri]|nr:hypothetical protein [Cellulomonas triticagri]